jgi:hypothetical protein
MTRVIEFPGADREVTGDYSPVDENERYAKAFRDLESEISDCVCMAQIAAECMSSSSCQDQQLSFAVFHLNKMLLDLKKHYYAAYEGTAGHDRAHPATRWR